MNNRKKLKIGLVGFGCVGYGLYRVLQQTPSFNAEITGICVRNPDKPRPIDPSHFTFDVRDLIENPEINVIVELIDDADKAFEIVRAALLSGKSVVSANKKMIAEHFDELYDLQQKTGSQLLYEAAACASIPVIRNLEEYYDNDSLKSICGIVNGSTNYILSNSQDKGLPFEESLKVAQELGYAESDPGLDVDGHDAAYKLQLLTIHAFGIHVRKSDILTKGIREIAEPELRYAAEKGYRIKLLASVSRSEDNRLFISVLPSFVKSDSDFYRVNDAFNGVQTETLFADRQFFSGRGAGDFPTASAVLSDISALSYDYRYEYKKLQRESNLELSRKVLVDVYLRVAPELEHEASELFEKKRETYSTDEYIVFNGTLGLGQLAVFLEKYPQTVLVHNSFIRPKAFAAGTVRESLNLIDS